MSVFNSQRLTNEVFKLDVERMRRDWYSDKYFENITATLVALAAKGYRFGGESPALTAKGMDVSDVAVGDIEVEMQWFTRREPYSLICGVDKALAMLRHCTGYWDENGEFVNTFEHLGVEAVQDGVFADYDGDPMNVQPVLFFPARFDAHEIQAMDGYAYDIAVQRFNRDFQGHLSSFISTDAQGDWWGGAGGGTIAHAAIACFLGDTAETMLAFAATRPVGIPRIALVDFYNDCIGDTLKTMKAMFTRYVELREAGRDDEARKYKLYGVRPDTSGDLRDVRMEPIGDPELDCGVTPRLVFDLRRAIDGAYLHWNLPPAYLDRARQWCRDVKIVVTGGFTPAKIARFEQLQVPADIYGVGSYLLSNCSHCGTNNDFTADVVRVKIHGQWHDMGKVGRRACDNPDLRKVQ